MLRVVRRNTAAMLLVLFTACGAGDSSAPERRIPHVVHAGDAAACKADTATLRAAEEAAFASNNAYSARSTPLHHVTVNGDSYVVTIADARCGTVGHTVGQTPADD
jgi:hypothetical protein